MNLGNLKITAKDGLIQFNNMCKTLNVQEILDIGCGKDQPHAELLREQGLTVLTNDFYDNNDYTGIFTDIRFNRKFEAIWCAHVLEHQPNVNLFLTKIYDILETDGLLAITVPPWKEKIVGGHLNVYNIGLLYYNLILAGFDCSQAIHKKYGYNITIILRKRPISNYPKLKYDEGDIEILAKYFPFKAVQGFDGSVLPNTF
jgi:SAM-dependent methyltransferase